MTSRFHRLLSAAAVTVAAGLALGVALPAGATTSPAPTPTPSGSASSAPAVTPAPSPSVRTTPSATPTAAPAPKPTPSAVTPSPAVTTTPTTAVPPVLTPPVVTPPVVTPPVPTPTPTPTRTRILPIPVATRINGIAGHSAYSRTITMNGTGFADLAAVQIAGVAVPDLVVVSPTVARFTLPNAIDYQPKVAPLSLVSREDGLARLTPLTFTYRIIDKLDRQMAYAFQNWDVRSNRVFGYLSGNDCANFASQTLLARGWPLSTQWFNRGTGRWSATWVSSTAMSNWLWKRKDLVTHLDYEHRDQATVGDIVQFRWAGHPKGYKSWDHTGIVSKVVVLPDGTHDLYYVSHTNDRQYGGSTQMFTKWMGKTLRMQFWHLKR